MALLHLQYSAVGQTDRRVPALFTDLVFIHIDWPNLVDLSGHRLGYQLIWTYSVLFLSYH